MTRSLRERPRDRPAAVDLPEDEREGDHVDDQDDAGAREQLGAGHVAATRDERAEHEADGDEVRDREQAEQDHGRLPPVPARHADPAEAEEEDDRRAAGPGSASTSQTHQSFDE